MSRWKLGSMASKWITTSVTFTLYINCSGFVVAAPWIMPRRKQRRFIQSFILCPAYQLRSRSPCFNTYCSTILQIPLLVQRCVSSFFWVDMSQCAKVRGPIKLLKMGNFLPKSTICHEFFWEVPCACMVRWHFPIPATVFWFPQSSLSQGKSIHLRFFLRQIRWDQRAEMDWKCFTWFWWISCWKLTSSWKCREQNLIGQWEHQLRVFVGLRLAGCSGGGARPPSDGS